jgi:hypothetical protein
MGVHELLIRFAEVGEKLAGTHLSDSAKKSEIEIIIWSRIAQVSDDENEAAMI